MCAVGAPFSLSLSFPSPSFAWCFCAAVYNTVFFSSCVGLSSLSSHTGSDGVTLLRVSGRVCCGLLGFRGLVSFWMVGGACEQLAWRHGRAPRAAYVIGLFNGLLCCRQWYLPCLFWSCCVVAGDGGLFLPVPVLVVVKNIRQAFDFAAASVNFIRRVFCCRRSLDRCLRSLLQLFLFVMSAIYLWEQL